MWDVTFINTQTGLPKTIYGVISIVAEMGDKTEHPFSLGTNWIPESADGD